jgi:putative spermidine/putrescine transport system permease protein
MFSNGGVLSWILRPFGITPPGFGIFATTMTLAYLWLPYMILPIYAGLERLPNSLLEASSDLGAPAWKTFRAIILPIIYPAIIAGSIFTFSLSLGDYIVVKIVGGLRN